MLKPLPASRWTPGAAAHLLSRAGFFATPDRVRTAHAEGLEATVSGLLQSRDPEGRFTPPDCATAPPNPLEKRRELAVLSPQEREQHLKEERRLRFRQSNDLTLWWLRRMKESASPLREKMTLFWHGHFTSSIRKVREPHLMWRQNEMFRERAFGHFGWLTEAVALDPAMILYLDLRNSNRSSPNENFARELMELFTLGEGNYTETDVKEAARAFTGLRIGLADFNTVFDPDSHDDGVKTFLGATGTFGRKEIIGQILTQRRCPEFIAAKLWKFFAEETPSPELATALGARYRALDFRTGPLLGEMFRSEAFYSPQAVLTQIKSPVQWLVGTLALLDLPVGDRAVFAQMLSRLGQSLFDPPNVKGWDGGTAWISTSTLLLRYNFAGALLGTVPLEGIAGPNVRFDAKRQRTLPTPNLNTLAPPDLRRDDTGLLAHLESVLYRQHPGEEDSSLFREFLATHPDRDDATLARLVHLMMSTPHYQLC